MSGIFISYRRKDSSGETGRLYDRLKKVFPARELFVDVDAIDPGVDFPEVLSNKLRFCDIMLVIIGPNWASDHDRSGRHRLDSEKDFVRMEITTALRRNIRVVPILLNNTPMPEIGELPDDLKPLARRQALELRHSRFDDDAEYIVKRCKAMIVGNNQGKPSSVQVLASTVLSLTLIIILVASILGGILLLVLK